jgi:hypothetical protein
MASFGQNRMNGYVPTPGYVAPAPGYGGAYNYPNNGGTFNNPNNGGNNLNRPNNNNCPSGTAIIPNNTPDYNKRYHQREDRKNKNE